MLAFYDIIRYMKLEKIDLITTVINKSAYSSTLKITSVIVRKGASFWRALARDDPF